jgi:putative transposase
MAIAARSFKSDLIHHSDRGVQYCSYDYTHTLKNNNIEISTTQNGEAYENAIAERVDGVLKTEFGLNQVFKSGSQALIKVTAGIDANNNLRPHMSCSFLTPEQTHFVEEPFAVSWNKLSLYFNSSNLPI